MVLDNFLHQSPVKVAAQRLYNSLAKQSRRPEFYIDAAVPDTVDGRFDMILLHVSLVICGLRKMEQDTVQLQQALFDEIFMHMDQSLREMGLSDARLSKQVRAMAEAFYGRLSAYEIALSDGQDALKDSLRRNLYGTTVAEGECVTLMADYVQRQAHTFDEGLLNEVVMGQIDFVPLFYAESLVKGSV